MKKTFSETMDYLVLLERLEKSLIEISSLVTQNPKTFRQKYPFYFVVINQERSGIYLTSKSYHEAHKQEKGAVHSRFETLDKACEFYLKHSRNSKQTEIFDKKELFYWKAYIRSLNNIQRKPKDNKENSNTGYYVVIDGDKTGIFTSEKSAIQATKKKNAFFNKCITLEEASEIYAKEAFDLKINELVRLNPMRIKDLEDSLDVQIKDVTASIQRVPVIVKPKKEEKVEKSPTKKKKKNSVNKNTSSNSKVEVFYAVKIGRRPGIYKTLTLTQEQVLNYPNSDYRKFFSFDEALSYLVPKERQGITHSFEDEQGWHFYIDGSYSHQMGNASYGITIHHPKGVLFDGGLVYDPVYSKSSQGTEFFACMRAIELAFVNKCKSIYIYYDNEETGRIVRGQKDYMSGSEKLLLSIVNTAKQTMNIQFIKIKGHSFVQPHNQADEVANSVRLNFGKLAPNVTVGDRKRFYVNSKNVRCFQTSKRVAIN